jgi:hypothetical protein
MKPTVENVEIAMGSSFIRTNGSVDLFSTEPAHELSTISWNKSKRFCESKRKNFQRDPSHPVRTLDTCLHTGYILADEGEAEHGAGHENEMSRFSSWVTRFWVC